MHGRAAFTLWSQGGLLFVNACCLSVNQCWYEQLLLMLLLISLAAAPGVDILLSSDALLAVTV